MDVKFISHKKEALEVFEQAKMRALVRIGLRAEGLAVQYETRVQTGRLRGSISHLVQDDRVVYGTNVEYAPYIELGARGKPPLHFLSNAARFHVDEYRRIVESEMKGTI